MAYDFELGRTTIVFTIPDEYGLKLLNAYDKSMQKSYHLIVPHKTIPLPTFLVLSDYDLKWYLDRAPTLTTKHIKLEHDQNANHHSSTEIARKRKAQLQRLTECDEDASLDLLTADEPLFLGSSHQQGGSSSSSSSSSLCVSSSSSSSKKTRGK